eukprot:CAMPEP_0172661824 /NCGR_PEP_ID=MMETSP1074-20121228/4967_1 /TAXON_ID=2916 /ORGANISM="Ceratium fusus, Strain PA161109" /LENGTH=129 /DNA_ID=CAMNT_0013477655 /DNA_START=81 /DNA_END=468 /DNA_ORIENTATION=+
MPKIKTGTALRWRDDRGFGFIKPDDGGDDIFVHRNSLGEGRDQRLEEGDRVEYEECFDDRKGKTNAENVVDLKEAEAAAEEAEAEADANVMTPVTVTAAAAGHTSRHLVDAMAVMTPGVVAVAAAAARW